MGIIILVRHGRSTANAQSVLAGRTPGVALDERGRQQAQDLVRRLAEVPITQVRVSPLQRCQETIGPLIAARGMTASTDERLAEVEYGNWTGRTIKDLSGEEHWSTVQQHASAAQFPGGESLADAGARAVRAARDAGTDADRAGGAALLCTHGDLIKAILADALGMHLDLFQRIVVAPASISVVQYLPTRAAVWCINNAGDCPPLPAVPDGATVGGETGRDPDAP